MNEQIQKLMRTLNVSEEEAKEILLADKEIDRGAKLFGLDKEAEKESKKARQATAGKKPMVCKFDTTKKKKPANESKTAIVANVVESLQEMGATDVNLTNPEREFTFKMGDVKYKIVLSVPRS